MFDIWKGVTLILNPKVLWIDLLFLINFVIWMWIKKLERDPLMFRHCFVFIGARNQVKIKSKLDFKRVCIKKWKLACPPKITPSERDPFLSSCASKEASEELGSACPVVWLTCAANWSFGTNVLVPKLSSFIQLSYFCAIFILWLLISSNWFHKVFNQHFVFAFFFCSFLLIQPIFIEFYLTNKINI